jgi:hypothetical protein
LIEWALYLCTLHNSVSWLSHELVGRVLSERKVPAYEVTGISRHTGR